MNYETWGIWQNTVPEQIMFFIMIAMVIWIVAYAIYDSWPKTHCDVCGEPIDNKTNCIKNRCDKCSGWRHISHAEYMKSFGIKPTLTRVK